MSLYHRTPQTTLRDHLRRTKAFNILMRRDPDWRAVKRAQRLKRAADRLDVIERMERNRAFWQSAAGGFHEAGAAMRKFVTAATAGMDRFMDMHRIPVLPPGDTLVVVKPAQRAGKTAAVEQELERQRAAGRTIEQISIGEHLAFRVSNLDRQLDLDDPKVQRAVASISAEHNRVVEALTRQALGAAPATPMQPPGPGGVSFQVGGINLRDHERAREFWRALFGDEDEA